MLEQKLQDGTAVYGVVGLGYVGLPLASTMAQSGHKVIGFDVSAEKVAAAAAGKSYIADVDSALFARQVADGLFEATTDFSRAADCDAIAICVPTPLDKMRDPDVSFMVEATTSIAPHLSGETLVTLESTTYPGTTDEIVAPILEQAGHTLDADVFVAFSPERVDPGNPTHHTKDTPKVVGGVTPRSGELAVLFYRGFLDAVVPVSTARAAEMSKLLENIFRCVNIALVNELVQLCERMGINMWEVVDSAKTKPFGFMPFYPGPGLGGHCIPIDPFYLSWKAREFDFHTQFIELSGKVNENMPYYVCDRLMSALNTQRKPLAGSRILALGVAYKADIDDMRESPAVGVIDRLLEREAEVVYHDPYVPQYQFDGNEIESVPLTAEEIERADAVVILTAHTTVDYALVAKHAKLIFDTRNAMKDFVGEHILRL
ncbi:MAG: nucleotide sugar dehydrogenase, partial [Actinomycetia bacterium]|nr:nucleotide sugar dehydrogenase [Actinomycetes bacterium]